MKAWEKIPCKQLFSLESASEAVTPIVGSLLMLLILFVLAGAATSIIFSTGESSNSQPPIAKITLESCEGGLSPKDSSQLNDEDKANFQKNRIILLHEGGNSLLLDSTAIKISGDGNAYQGIVAKGGHFLYGSTEVTYKNLGLEEKNATYTNQNDALLEDGLWSVGERLILHGRDSWKYDNSSVKVSVNGDNNTSDNYGFKAGSEITVKVIDVKSSNVIAQQRAIVKHAD